MAEVHWVNGAANKHTDHNWPFPKFALAAAALMVAVLATGSSAMATPINYEISSGATTTNDTGTYDVSGTFTFDPTDNETLSADIILSGDGEFAGEYTLPPAIPNNYLPFSTVVYATLDNADDDIFMVIHVANSLSDDATDPLTGIEVGPNEGLYISTATTGEADPVPSPEPASLALLLSGLFALRLIRRRRI
jgi:MYXO-CTERM domain-containing protein